jgi:brefeldin A-inhibited guanine nucleotide-exchange protein
MRSKYLSLQLINLILRKYVSVFQLPVLQPGNLNQIATDKKPIPFVLAVKQHLILTLSRNAVSLIPGLAYICLDSFCALMKSGIREYLKVCV